MEQSWIEIISDLGMKESFDDPRILEFMDHILSEKADILFEEKHRVTLFHLFDATITAVTEVYKERTDFEGNQEELLKEVAYNVLLYMPIALLKVPMKAS